MKKLSKSPERMTFQQERSVKKLLDPASTIEERENAQAYIDMWATWKAEADARELDPEWQKNNMEYDLRTCDPILKKVQESDNYAQNLYAAMCNMEWQKRELWPELKEERWSCSWRSAGGVVANMREEGDYIDWYCSGIGNTDSGYGLDGTVPKVEEDGRTYVSEGVVTEEIELDLNKLGWRPVPYKDDDY